MPSNLVCLWWSREAPFPSQPFSVALWKFGIGNGAWRSLQGPLYFCFMELISCGSEALFFGLVAGREVLESVSQLELSLSSLTFRSPC